MITTVMDARVGLSRDILLPGILVATPDGHIVFGRKAVVFLFFSFCFCFLFLFIQVVVLPCGASD